MKKEELLKLCQYYHGEDTSPYGHVGIKDQFWILEKAYVDTYQEDDPLPGMALKEWPELAEFFDKNGFDPGTRRMLCSFVILSYSHNPMGGINFIYDYGK